MSRQIFILIKNNFYRAHIDIALEKIYTNGPLSNADIESIQGECSMADSKFANINEPLSSAEMVEELVRVDNVVDIQTKNKFIIFSKMYELEQSIEKLIQKDDTRDTQSMRNVIGISIAVCAIVTLCIVLLIAVRNKHRANAEVRLLKWV